MIGEKWIPGTVSDVKVTCHNENVIDVSFSIVEILESYLRRVWVNFHQKINRAAIEKGNVWNIPMIENIFAKRETKSGKSNVNISDNSQQILRVWWVFGKSYPIRMVGNAYQFLSFFVRKTRNRPYNWLRQFLNEFDVKISLCLQDSIGKQIVLANVLRKDIDFFYNHSWVLLTAEWINLFLLSQISWYFFEYHSLLNWYFQKGHKLELA